MKIEIVKLQIHEDMSKETRCFSAIVRVDQKDCCHVKNAGHGGCHNYVAIDQKLYHEFWQYCQGLTLEFEFEKMDQVVDALIDEWVELRWLEKHSKDAVMFRLKGDVAGKWRRMKPRNTGTEDHIRKQYGDKVERIF